MQSPDLLLHSSQRGSHWSPTGSFSSALTLALLEFGREGPGQGTCLLQVPSESFSFFSPPLSIWLPLPSRASSWVLGLCVTQRHLISCCSDWMLPRPMGTAAGACHHAEWKSWSGDRAQRKMPSPPVPDSPVSSVFSPAESLIVGSLFHVLFISLPLFVSFDSMCL